MTQFKWCHRRGFGGGAPEKKIAIWNIIIRVFALESLFCEYFSDLENAFWSTFFFELSHDRWRILFSLSEKKSLKKSPLVKKVPLCWPLVCNALIVRKLIIQKDFLFIILITFRCVLLSQEFTGAQVSASIVLCEMIFVWFQIMPAALVISCMRAKSAIVNTHINLPEIEANLPEIHIGRECLPK